MRKSTRKYLIAIVIIVIALVLLQTVEHTSQDESFRQITELVYSRHAKCRMDCRNINEQEIREIIRQGRINEAKSGYDKKHQNQTYALEGYSYETQHLRVVVTPRRESLFVITVIDLDKDWVCDCK